MAAEQRGQRAELVSAWERVAWVWDLALTLHSCVTWGRYLAS